MTDDCTSFPSPSTYWLGLFNGYMASFYPGCYESERNACCQLYSNWGRNCDSPMTNCDLGGGSPLCSLLKEAQDTQAQVLDLGNQIADLNAKLAAIAPCCDYATISEQLQCINDATQATAGP